MASGVPSPPPARRRAPPASPYVHVRHRPRPMSPDPGPPMAFAPGGTVAEILDAVQADPILRRHCHVTINGELVPREMWRAVRPKAGTLLTCAVMPENGQTALRAVLIIAIAVAAVYTGGAAATAAGGAGTLGGALAGAAASTAITIGGTLAVNALPPR